MTDLKPSERFVFIRAAIEALPIHSIGGYEWECANCEYDWQSGMERDALGNVCDHETLIDRELVLRLLNARLEVVTP